MTLLIERQSPTVGVIQLAKQIEVDAMSRDKLIPELIQGIFDFVGKLDLDQLQCGFFAYELRTAGFGLQSAADAQVPLLAQKVQRAAEHLGLVSKPKASQLIIENEVAPDPVLAEAFLRKDGEKIRARALQMETIEKGQLELLYNWAAVNWDAPVLNHILYKWSLPDDMIDALVAMAFELDQFPSIAYPVFLRHVADLEDSVQEKVIDWFNELSGTIYSEIAGDLHEMELALNGIDAREFRVVELSLCRSALDKRIAQVSTQFLAPRSEQENTSYDVAYTIWNETIKAWRNQEISPTELQEGIRAVLELLREPKVDENAPSLRRSSPPPSYGTFDGVGVPEADGKFDPGEFLDELHGAVEANRAEELQGLIASRKTRELTEKDFRGLLDHAMLNHFDCLEKLLDSSKVSKDLFMDYFLAALYQPNWEKLVLYFLSTAAIKRISFEELAPFTEKFATAESLALQHLFNNLLQ